MKSILVVDDNDLFIKTMEISLEREGYKVTTALSGLECINQLKIARPDLVLMDIMMPQMDGWTALRKIKGDKSLASLPVILISAKEPTADILAKKEELGFIDYFTKPFEMVDVCLRIAQILQSCGKIKEDQDQKQTALRV